MGPEAGLLARVVADALGGLLPETMTAATAEAGARAAAGALEWGAGSAAGYGVDCAINGDCSRGGLVAATLLGASFGAIAGPLGLAEGESGCSFAASTPVATPSGARAIGSLKVGDKVLAYNPTTGKSEAEPVQHVWRNHDHDLVDVQLTTTDTTKTSDTTSADRSGATAQPPTASKTASTR